MIPTSVICGKPANAATPPTIRFISAMSPTNAISIAPTLIAIRSPTDAPDAAASITLAARLSSKSSPSTTTRLGSTVGYSSLPNSSPPGTAMNDAASRYSIRTPRPA